LLVFWSFETDLAFRRRRGRTFELLDFIHDDGNDRSVLLLRGFQLFDPGGQVFVGGQHVPELDERADDQDVHLDGPATPEYGEQHSHAVPGEGIGQVAAATAPFL